MVPDRADIASWQAAGSTVDPAIGTRLQAVLILSTTTVGRLSNAFDRPFVVIGYSLAAVMMLAPRHRFPGPHSEPTTVGGCSRVRSDLALRHLDRYCLTNTGD